MHPLVKLAKSTVEKKARSLSLPDKENIKSLPEEFITEAAGVFVCIKKKGHLRGCIGTFAPTTDNIALEIIRNAVSASTKDPRFAPITEDELPDLEYSVDVLTSPEPVDNPDHLDPKRYGVIVSCGQFKRGLLLPDLDGVDTIEDQLGIAMSKADIEPEEEDIMIERFEVKRYK
jgi:hypothetical protein